MTAHVPTTSKTVGQLVAERPERGRLFEKLGIDYCCGGRKPLRDACVQKGLDPDHVRAQLEAADALPSTSTDPDWTTAPLGKLADHITLKHHDLMRRELPRVSALVQKVARVHGDRHPELIELNRLFEEFSSELVEHMAREDSVLFPWIRALESDSVPSGPPRGVLDQPIRRMMQDHDDAGVALARMRALTNGFTPPEDACGTYRVMLSGLREIEADMHVHVHKENNILFPRALVLEAAIRASK
jgi:regulator of cell morphogenesis and NO signaling